MSNSDLFNTLQVKYYLVLKFNSGLNYCTSLREDFEINAEIACQLMKRKFEDNDIITDNSSARISTQSAFKLLLYSCEAMLCRWKKKKHIETLTLCLVYRKRVFAEKIISRPQVGHAFKDPVIRAVH